MVERAPKRNESIAHAAHGLAETGEARISEILDKGVGTKIPGTRSAISNVFIAKDSSASLRPPQFLDETEALIGLPAYTDPERECALQDNFESINPDTLGARVLLYTKALRIFASARHEDRQLNKGQEDARTFNDRWARTLTVKGIAQIADAYRAEVRPIARQLAMRHNIEQFLTDEEGKSTLHPHQHSYLEGIAQFLQSGSVPVLLTDEAGKKVTYFSQGATVVAPSGIGKTVLMAHTIKGLGIGNNVEGARRGEQHLRALIVVPSQELVQQFKGEIGDNTFRRFAPDVTVGGYYEEEKDDKADVVVITQQKFVDDFRDGKLNEEEFDIAMIDEAHHLTAPKFLQTLRKHWSGPAIGFTATPDYAPEKDVRTVLPYEIYHGDAIDYIKDGALNAGQLIMFRVDPWEHRRLLPSNVNLEDPQQKREAAEDLLDQSVVDFVIPMLKEGRRGMIFGEYGGWAAHARHLAALLSDAKEANGAPIILPGGKPIRAEAIGDFRRVGRDGSLSPKVIQEYNDGDVHVITTTEMGREGFNADIDFVIVASPTFSMLKLKQIIGRGTRLSDRFPTTVYAQFFIAPEAGDRKTLTLFEAFGLEQVNQGVRIGPRSVLADNRRTVRTARLPRHLKEMSAHLHLRPIAEAVAASEEIEIPEGYKPLGRIAEDSRFTEGGAKRVLLEEGFSWVGRSEMIDGERRFVRYYEPAAEAYLHGHKKATPVKTGDISISTLAKELGVSPDFVRGRVQELISNGSVSLEKHTKRGREREYLNEQSRVIIEQYIQEIPTASPDDRSAQGLATTLGYGRDASAMHRMASHLGIPIIYKRLPETEHAIYQYVVEGDIATQVLTERFGEVAIPKTTARLREELAEKLSGKESAKPTDMTRSDICRMAGIKPEVSQAEVDMFMTEEEFALGQMKAVTSDDGVHKKSGAYMVWSHEVGMQIAERIKRRHVSLPPYLVPLTAIVNGVSATTEGVRKYLKKIEQDSQRLPLPDAPKTTCYSWKAFEEAQRRFGRALRFRINFSLLPSDSNDNDLARIAYAKGIQYLLMPEQRLGFNEDELELARSMADKIKHGQI